MLIVYHIFFHRYVTAFSKKQADSELPTRSSSRTRKSTTGYIYTPICLIYVCYNLLYSQYRINNPTIDSEEEDEDEEVGAPKAIEGRGSRSHVKELVTVDEGPFSPEREDDGSLKIEKVHVGYTRSIQAQIILYIMFYEQN